MSERMPSIPLALVEALEKRFPNRLPTRHELRQITDGEVAFKSGQCDVIQFLRAEHQRQEEAALEE